MIKVGLTGGYGTGKSTVTRMFSELGAPTISADDIVHSLLSDDEQVISKVADIFGRDILIPDGAVDRKKAADIVFDDEASLASLTDILYPIVRQKITGWFDERLKEEKHTAAIADVSMLIEGGALELYDRIVLVTTDSEVQRARCLAEGISPDEFTRRVRNQTPLEEKIRFADYVIDNNGILEETRKQVLEVWDKLRKLQ